MKFNRTSGILLHPTSLPGPYGIGDLGPNAYRWIDWLAESGCSLWQILPLGPTGYGDSPYQCFSAFAGNPYLISPEIMLNEGLLTPDDLNSMPDWNPERVDFGQLFHWKPAILNAAYTRFRALSNKNDDFMQFKSENAYWLDDYSLFMALKENNGGGSWSEWENELKIYDVQRHETIKGTYLEQTDRIAFYQYMFFKQWNLLKEYANKRGISIIGDVPIFVAMDSCDVWSHPELFHLDANRNPTVVAGVPPDYFSPTGQLWGNPLYRWEAHKESGYDWWSERIRAALKMVDIIRIDHFRGFVGYWAIPRGAPTAEHGQWLEGPGADFFHILQDNFGDLPIIAEDLGFITADVNALRDEFSFPGMKILQFAFSGPDNPFLPHNHTRNSVVYTGTHDNDTARGWYESAPQREKDFAKRYFQRDWQNDGDFSWDMIRTAWNSVAKMAIAPIQDFLCLGTEARFNFPSRLGGNWEWRMKADDLCEVLLNKIREINWLYQR